MRIYALLLVVVLGLSSLLTAGTGTAAVNAWELIHPKSFDWRQAGHRRAVARDLAKRLNLLASAVPPQSEGQRTLVLEELAELQRLGTEATPRRRGRLYMSRGYQHFRLMELMGETQADLDCILSAASIHEEMHCWSLAALHFGDEARLDLALSMLRRARLMPKDDHMPVAAQDPEVWYGEYGRGILEHILVPYLADAAAGGAGAVPHAEGRATPVGGRATLVEGGATHADSGAIHADNAATRGNGPGNGQGNVSGNGQDSDQDGGQGSSPDNHQGSGQRNGQGNGPGVDKGG